MLVLIDGRTVYTPLFSGVFWQNMDMVMEDIERIEVIRGLALHLQLLPRLVRFGERENWASGGVGHVGARLGRSGEDRRGCGCGSRERRRRKNAGRDVRPRGSSVADGRASTAPSRGKYGLTLSPTSPRPSPWTRPNGIAVVSQAEPGREPMA